MLTPGYLSLLINYELLVTLLLIFVSANFVWRFWKVKRLAMLYLALTFILFSLAAFCVALSHSYHLVLYPVHFQEYIYNGIILDYRHPLQIYTKLMNYTIIYTQDYLTASIYTFALPFVMAELGNLFLYSFTLNAFLEKKMKWIILYLVIFIPIFVITLLTFELALNFMLALVIGLITYVPLIYLALGAFRLTTEKVYRYGFILIMMTSVFLSLFFVFYFIDGTLTQGWSIFEPIAWTMGLLASICAYIGYVLPEWFRRIVGK